MPDLWIKNALIVDGTGKKPYNGNILVSGDKIRAIIAASSSVVPNSSKKGDVTTIDASGLAVAPGFVDVHNHFDWVLPLSNHPDFLYPMVEQGITTIVCGNCGFSPVPVDDKSKALLNRYAEFTLEEPLKYPWRGMGEFLDHLESDKGPLFNTAELVGHGTVHIVALKDELKRPDENGLKKMIDMTEEAFDEGAFGLSMGLAYSPGLFSTRGELLTMAKAAKKYNRALTVHIKALNRISGAYPIIPGGKPHNLKALDEILSLAMEAEVRLLISHFIFVGSRTWKTAGRAIRKIEKARKKGLEVMWDIYPHFCGNTYIIMVLPAWFIENWKEYINSAAALKRLKFELALTRKLLGFGYEDAQVMEAGFKKGEKFHGKNVAEIGEILGIDPFDAIVMLIRESNGKALILFHKFSGDEGHEDLIESIMSHELCLFETDTILKSRGFPNPASYGAFPRILGRFVREKKVMSLAEAVSKMTGRSARWIGLKDRGEIKPGNFADLVLFDPEEIADTTTIKETASRPLGIKKVFINGKLVVDNGKYIKGKRAGRVLRYS